MKKSVGNGPKRMKRTTIFCGLEERTAELGLRAAEDDDAGIDEYLCSLKIGQ